MQAEMAEKQTSSEESEEVTEKTEQPATCCMIRQGEKKVTKLKREALEKVAEQMNLLCDYNFHQRKRTAISRLHGQDRLLHRVKTRANRYLISP